MRRETSLFLTLGLLSTIAPPIFAQDLQGQPDPVPPSSIIVGPQLIAWSGITGAATGGAAAAEAR